MTDEEKLSSFTPLSEELPNDKEMVVFIGYIDRFRVVNYLTDPYCGWMSHNKFVRWPHEFPPTHFKRLW